MSRLWRRWRRRSLLLQASTIAVVVVLVAGVGYVVARRSPSSPPPTSIILPSAHESTNGPTTPVAPDRASTSSRGVTSSTINVVFPVANLNGLASQFGFAGDPEDSEQVKAIKFYVSQVNRGGGINGRKINAIISNYDPTNEAEMRSLCKDWTEGSPSAFAVIDGLGSWNGDNELCITEEGQTPFIGEWTTVTNWTTKGSPYLWWLGPDQAAIVKTLVTWADTAGLIGTGKVLGIVAGDRASDQLALNEYLLPDLEAMGVTHPVVETIGSNPSDTATTSSQAPLIVQRFKAAGVTAVIPLVPVNSFFPYLLAETSQQFFPHLLLSDYESTIEIGLGLVPAPFEQAVDNQEGITVQTLGGIDDDRPESEGGYDPGVRSCFDSFAPVAPIPSRPLRFTPGRGSRSRDPSPVGVRGSDCSPRPPAMPAATSPGARSSRPWPTSRIIRAH